MKNIISTPAELVAYFRSLADRHPGIRSFVVGDSERILSLDRQQLRYPALWLETPRTNWKLKEPAQAVLSGAFVVLTNTRIDDDVREQYVLDTTWQITRDLVNMMRNDARADYIDAIPSSFSSDPILGYGTDNDFGWRTVYQLEAPIGNCPSVCAVANACPAGALARFDWENRRAGDFTDLVITPTFTPDVFSGVWDTVKYFAYVDDKAVLEFDVPPVSVSSTGHKLRLVLVLTKGECVLTASAYFSNEIGCGTSVPFLLQKEHYI